MKIHIKLKGDLSQPRERVLAMEMCAASISKTAGVDPADAIFALMTAAAHLSLIYSEKPEAEVRRSLDHALDHALTFVEAELPREGGREAANDG